MSLFKTTPRLYKHRGRYSTIFYNPETRKEKWVSLGTSSKSIADRRHRELCYAYERGDWKPEDGKYRFGALTVGIATDRFVDSRKREGRSPRTISDYRWFLDMLKESVPAGLPLVHLSSSHCRKIVEQPPSRAARRGYHRRLRAFLNWCVKEGYIKDSPLKAVVPPKRVRKRPAYLTREEFARFVYAIDEAAAASEGTDRQTKVRLSRYARLAVSTGLRLKELQALTWGDIDTEGKRVGVVGKGEKYRSIPLFPDARDVLEEVREEHTAAYGLPPARTERVLPGLPYFETCHQITHFLRKTDLKHKAEGKATHLFRSTFASWLVSDGVSIFHVSKWLGHSNTVITQDHYAELAPDYVPEAAMRVFSGD